MPRALETLDRRRKAILIKRRAFRADAFADDHLVHRRLVGDARIEIGESASADQLNCRGPSVRAKRLSVKDSSSPAHIAASLIARSCDRRRTWSAALRSARAIRRRRSAVPPHRRRPRCESCAPRLRYRRGFVAGLRSSARVTPASASCGMSEAASRLDRVFEHMAAYSRRPRNIPCTGLDRARLPPPKRGRWRSRRDATPVCRLPRVFDMAGRRAGAVHVGRLSGGVGGQRATPLGHHAKAAENENLGLDLGFGD